MDDNKASSAENDVPNFMWRGLAETILKATRWDEWKANGWRWQHEQITLLARELEKWLPRSEAVLFLLAQAWDAGYWLDRDFYDESANPHRARPIPPVEGDA